MQRANSRAGSELELTYVLEAGRVLKSLPVFDPLLPAASHRQ